MANPTLVPKDFTANDVNKSLYSLSRQIANSTSSSSSTSSIYDSGTNTNGSWIRFVDGTMICWRSLITITQTANTQYNTAYAYPMAFSSVPTVTSSYSQNTAWAGTYYSTAYATINNWQVVSNPGSTTQSQAVYLMANGKWSETAQVTENVYNITTSTSFPYFKYNNTTGVASGNIIPGVVVYDNMGGAATSGVYTIKQAGIYRFTLQALLPYATTGEHRYSIKHNSLGQIGACIVVKPAANVWHDATAEAMASCRVGDTVSAYYDAGGGTTYTDAGWCYFMGNMVSGL